MRIPCSPRLVLTLAVLLAISLPTTIVTLSTILAHAVSAVVPHHAPLPAAMTRSNGERRQASRPVLGGVPTVVASGTAYGIQESGRHACRAVLGTAYHGAAVQISITRYDGATDCTAAMADEGDAARTLLRTLP